MPDIDELLRKSVKVSASDLHITVGMPPIMRVNGELTKEDMPPLTPGDTEEMARHLLSEDQWSKFEKEGEIDFSYGIKQVGRFRVNCFRQRGTVAIVLRVINHKAPTLDELGFPQIVKDFANKPKGLVLVTGPTGSGKSTTLAAMINMINQEKKCHIITIEDPIEYLHSHGKSIVNQREVGSDTKSFAVALRSALREDPDVILVGEMRDLESIAIAITAAETGHLVLATLHTVDAPQTVDRIIDVFPPHQQQQIRVQLANTLVGIIAQQLIPRRQGDGRVAALEIMAATPAARNLIREGKVAQLYSVMQTGGKFGMQTMDTSLRNLYQQGVISKEEAVNRAADKDAMARQ